MTTHKPQPWPGSTTRKPSLKPIPSAPTVFLQRAFLGIMTPEDQAYMARAMLQMSDEIAGANQRIIALDMALKDLRGQLFARGVL